jgi:preprotein translocase subunit SecY
MPIIFASSLMIFPSMGGSYVAAWLSHGGTAGEVGGGRTILTNITNSFKPGEYLYETFYIAMIFFFSYFWNTVQFQPKEMANQLRDYGSFIPGLRPGKRTADYLENVMTRITYVGAAFLCIVAIIPSIVSTQVLGGTSDAYQISAFLGGTGLLIVVQVLLDFVNRIEASLVMRNYGGFLDGGKGNRAKRTPGGPVRGGPRVPEPATFSSDKPKGLPT